MNSRSRDTTNSGSGMRILLLLLASAIAIGLTAVILLSNRVNRESDLETLRPTRQMADNEIRGIRDDLIDEALRQKRTADLPRLTNMFIETVERQRDFYTKDERLQLLDELENRLRASCPQCVSALEAAKPRLIRG